MSEKQQVSEAPERLRLVKMFAYEYVRFNHDPNHAYLVTDVTDDCMLELEGMSGLFAPSLFQQCAAPTPGADGRYCQHHDDDPAHGRECYTSSADSTPVAPPARPYFCSCGGALTAEEYITHFFELGHDRGSMPVVQPPEAIIADLRDMRSWLIYRTDGDGKEYTAWPERVAQIDRVLQWVTEPQGESGNAKIKNHS